MGKVMDRQENVAFFFLLFINIGRIGRDLCRIGRVGRIGTLSLWYNWILLSCCTVTYDTE